MDDRLEADTGGAKVIRKTVSRWWKQRYNLGAISPRKAKKCKSRLKRGYEELKEMYGEENIISAGSNVDETTPHLHCDFVPLTVWVNLSAKDEAATKRKCAGSLREIS